MSRRGGWRREGSRGHFRYVDARGNRIADDEKLERIRTLVIPPAWEDVWISPRPSAKLQATGVDAAYLRSKADEIKNSGCRKVLADFSLVPYIDSTGVSFLVGIYVSIVKDSGGRFVLASVNRRVREVLDLTRISTVIPIFTDRDSGLAALCASAAQV